VSVVDVDEKRARALAEEIGCEYSANWCDAVCDERVDAVVVSTPNKFMQPWRRAH
jgi:predicted dehydrogenase